MRRRPRTASNRLIVALDVSTLSKALAIIRPLRGLVRTIKIGSILFTACGPEAIHRVRTLGFDVMLDLKFHDIPSTVEASCRAAVHHRIAMATVHACGEAAMLEAAVHGMRDEAKQAKLPRPFVLGITVLTSVAPSRGARPIKDRVMRLARAAVRAGCDGVVASAHEAHALRRAFGSRFLIVCPGIRPQEAVRGDQQRVASPADAIANGADALVVGRPITAAVSPRAATLRVLEELERNPC